MNINRRTALIITLNYAVIILVTIVAFFLLSSPESRTPSFWISFTYALLVESAIFVYVMFLFRNYRSSQELHPIYFVFGTILSFYFVAVVINMGVFWLWLDISSTYYFMIQLLTLAVAVVLFGTFAIKSTYVKNHDHSLQASVQQLKELQLIITAQKNKLALWENPLREELMKQLEDLGERFRFSDPVSHASLASLENEIRKKLSTLEEMVITLVEGKDKENQLELQHLIQEIANTLVERNQRLALLK